MKKFIIALTFLTVGLYTTQAQEMSDNTIGLRFSENGGIGAEFTYQRKLTDSNRLEVDLGLRSTRLFSVFKATGLYQWVWTLEGDFNWYAGAGGGLGSWKIKDTDFSDTFIFGAGVVGVEYNFDFPLQVSLDFRPEIGFSKLYDGLNADFGLSARYRF